MLVQYETNENDIRKMFAPTVQCRGHEGEIHSVKFSYWGDYLASAGFDKKIMVWKVFDQEFKNVVDMNAHKNGILDIWWSLDSAKMYSCSADKTVAVWDLIEGKRIKKYKDHEGIVNSVQAPKRGEQMFVTTSDDWTVRLFDERIKQAASTVKLTYQATTATFSDTNDYIFLWRYW